MISWLAVWVHWEAGIIEKKKKKKISNSYSLPFGIARPQLENLAGYFEHHLIDQDKSAVVALILRLDVAGLAVR